MSMVMMADGEKIIKCTLTQPKLFMQPDILLMISDFFNNAWPKYTATDKDKPYYYSTETGNAARQEILLEMREGIIVLENQEDS